MTMIRIKRLKTRKSELMFMVAYICFFAACFAGDIGIESSGKQELARNLRYVSYVLSLAQLTTHRARPKRIMIELMAWVVAMTFFLYTKDIYLPMLVVLIIGSKDVSKERIFDISLKFLVAGTVFVVLGSIIGLIPDIMTAKAFSTELTRHSYGFYHSNVLPNNLLMIEILTVWKYKEKITYAMILLFFGGHVIVYCASASRMSLFVGLILTAGLLFLKVRMFSSKMKRFLVGFAYLITPLYTVASIVLMLFVNTNAFVKKLDLVFSNRFWAAFLKMNNVGAKIINFNSNELFYGDGVVLDNGYLFVLMRYGLILLLVINAVSISLVKKNKYQPYRLVCIICVFTVAFIDNIFLSYRFLPFLMAAIVGLKIKGLLKIRGLQTNTSFSGTV